MIQAFVVRYLFFFYFESLKNDTHGKKLKWLMLNLRLRQNIDLM